MDITDKYLTVTQCADEAGVTSQAIRKMIKLRQLDAILLGKQYIVKQDDFKRYLERKHERERTNTRSFTPRI